ncbi:hypothetical protein ACCS93_37320 [Rhizobium ruizarguesonis]
MPGIFEEASKELSGEEPVYMINMVKYRREAYYEQDSGLPPCSGREAYLNRYAPAFAEVAQGERYSVFRIDDVKGMLAAPPENWWDDVVIVKCANLATLRRIFESPVYAAVAAPHCRASLAAWRSVVTTKKDFAT